jgi:hypothetical protein
MKCDILDGFLPCVHFRNFGVLNFCSHAVVRSYFQQIALISAWMPKRGLIRQKH